MEEFEVSTGPTEKPAKKEVPKSEPWPSLLKSFTQDTTLHGIRYTTLESRFTIRRVIWTIFLLGASGVFTYYLINRVNEYRKFKTNISVAENYVDSMAFPAVTICNQNPFRLTSAANGSWYSVAKILTDTTTNADPRACNANEFKCGSNVCILSSRKCDGFPDCVDKSDETFCNPCPRIVITRDGSVTSATQDLITAYEYDLQEKTYKGGHTVYISTHPTSPVYLSYDDHIQQWVFRPFSPLLPEYASTQDPAINAQDIATRWLLDDNNLVTLSFQCAESKIALNQKEQPADMSLTLEFLYNAGVQPYADFVQECYWKGDPCNKGDFKAVNTDLGICYTFKRDDLVVERSGPGYGLRATINIEQFEYVKDPSTGSGIQILMHAPEDIPYMQGNSLAISPGLMSMVALERTVVDNLEPPWGNCTVADFKYYPSDPYTTNKCNLDCEGELAREECKCRDINMPPVGNSDFPSCSADKYTKCIKEIFIAAKKKADFCPCGTPCVNTVYVPSLSFATIAGDTNSEDAASAKLKERLMAAREVSHRVEDDLFRDTIRIFNVVDQGMSKAIHFVEAADLLLKMQSETVISVGVEIGRDCHFFVSLTNDIAAMLTNKVFSAVVKYLTFYHSQTVGSLLQFQKVMQQFGDEYTAEELSYLNTREGIIEFTMVNTNLRLDNASMSVDNVTLWTDLYNGSYYTADLDISVENGILNASAAAVWLSDDKFWNHTSDIWVRFATLRTALKFALVSLQASRSSLFDDLRHFVDNLTDASYVVQKDLISPLQAILRVKCDWCSDQNNQTLISIIKTHLVSFMDDTLTTTLDQMHVDLITIYNLFLKAVSSQDEAAAQHLINVDLVNLTNKGNDLYVKINDAMYTTLRQSGAYLNELIRVMEPKCGSELKQLQESVLNNQIKIDSVLKEMLSMLKSKHEDFVKSAYAYIDDKTTLTTIAYEDNLSEIIANIQPRISTASNLLTERGVIFSNYEQRTNNLYYWLMAQWNNSYLAQNSLYWSRFAISPESVTVDMPNVTPPPGDILGFEKYVMIPNTKANNFWSNQQKDISFQNENFAYHNSRLTTASAEATLYLSTYAAGNELGESFYAKNILQMDIYYKALTDKKIVQQKAYEYPALLSELGGLLGLLLGASCITLFEVCDLVWYNCCVKCFERHRRRKNRQRDIEAKKRMEAGPLSTSWPANDSYYRSADNS